MSVNSEHGIQMGSFGTYTQVSYVPLHCRPNGVPVRLKQTKIQELPPEIRGDKNGTLVVTGDTQHVCPSPTNTGINIEQYDYSFGIVPFRFHQRLNNELQFLLICHKYSNEWGIPKGHIDRGENPNGSTTAIREFEEETGLKKHHLEHVYFNQPFTMHYQFRRNRKMRYKTTCVFPGKVIDGIKPCIIRPLEISDTRLFSTVFGIF